MDRAASDHFSARICEADVEKYGGLLPENTKLENLTTTDETYRTGEEMACAVSCHVLAMKKHGTDIPWTKKASVARPLAVISLCAVMTLVCCLQGPMRKSADTRGVEGKFGGFRCNRLAASNT